MSTTFAPTPDAHRDVLRRTLDAARLPTEDLGAPGRRFFELSDDEGPIGFVAIEGDEPDRLLRSLVVLPGRQRSGYGGLLVARAEDVARGDGVARLHLLTNDAAHFFRARGYRDAERSDAPAAIRSTAQFASLCPDSATYLVKDLA